MIVPCVVVASYGKIKLESFSAIRFPCLKERLWQSSHSTPVQAAQHECVCACRSLANTDVGVLQRWAGCSSSPLYGCMGTTLQ